MAGLYFFKKYIIGFLSVLSLAGLSSCGTASYLSALTHPSKDWVQQPVRSIDGKDLVFVNSASDPVQARAEFIAVAKALEDLANECSYIPKGSHLEDRADTKRPEGFSVAVKLVIEDQLCEQAKKELLPENIKRTSNRGYTEQLQKYQLERNLALSEEPASRRENNVIHDDNDFFEMRQHIALLKTEMILAGKDLDQLGLKHQQEILQTLSEEFAAAHTYEVANPTLKSSSLTWSKVQTQIAQNQKTQKTSGYVQKNLSKTKRSQRKPAQNHDQRPKQTPDQRPEKTSR